MSVQKYDLEWCQNYAKNKGGICLSSEFLGRKTRLKYQCANGHIFEATPFAHIYKNSWCNVCSKRDVKHNLEFVRKHIESRDGKLLSTEYSNVRQKLIVVCDKGHQWNPTFQNIYHNKSWCPYCAGVGGRTYGKRVRIKGFCCIKALKIELC